MSKTFKRSTGIPLLRKEIVLYVGKEIFEQFYRESAYPDHRNVPSGINPDEYAHGCVRGGFIWLEDNPSLDTVYHESIHVSMRIFEDSEINVMKEEEFFVQVSSWIFSWLVKTLKRNKIKLA